MSEDLASFTIEAMVRGYHVYRDVWHATMAEQLPCQREIGNVADPFAVAIVKSGAIVGHVPRRISSVCSVFLRRNGSIVCCITGSRRYSADLVQGGLEIPCTLTFEGSSALVLKAKALLQALSDKKNMKEEKEGKHTEDSLTTPPDPPASPPSKKKKISEDSQKWLQYGGIVLSQKDKRNILKGDKLNDLVIDFAQQLLKSQNLGIYGMQCTLLQSKKLAHPKNQLQILHVRGDHWIVASTLLATDGLIYIYDTIYQDINKETVSVLENLFGLTAYVMINIPKQSGSKDCGVYAIAIITALAHGENPATIKFKQDTMRPHLVHCLETESLTMFSNDTIKLL